MVSKKFFAKAFALAMATGLLAVAAPAATQVWATGGTTPPSGETSEEPTESAQEIKAEPVTATISYYNMSLEIRGGHGVKEENGKKVEEPDNYVFLEVMKKKDDTKVGTVYPFPCSGNVPVYVDLSFLKITKECYLRVWGDNSKEKVTLTVSAQPTKIKYKYATQTFPELKETKDLTGDDLKAAQAENQGKLIEYYSKSFGITDTSLSYYIRSLYGATVIELKDVGEVPTDGSEPKGDGKWDFIEYSNGNGGSQMNTKDQLKNVKVTGTTLIIFQGAAEDTHKTEGGKQVVDKAGHPAGAEVKVKIPAAPKAPKVTIDYAKGTIKLPKNAQYGIIKDGEIEYVTLASGGALSPKAILENIATELGLEDKAKTETKDADPAKTNFINKYLAEGFDLVVRTNDAKKGASNPAFVSVKETITYDDDKWGKITRTTKDSNDKDVVTEIATYEFSEEGLTVTVKSGTFEYEESGKWKKITSGKLIKGKTSELTIRMAGVKDKDEIKAALPSTEMTIKKPVDKSKVEIKADPAKTVEAGAKITLSVDTTDGKILDRNGEKPAEPSKLEYAWASGDTTIATVAADGKVTGVKAGTCTITVTVTFEDGTTATGSIDITVTAKSGT